MLPGLWSRAFGLRHLVLVPSLGIRMQEGSVSLAATALRLQLYSPKLHGFLSQRLFRGVSYLNDLQVQSSANRVLTAWGARIPTGEGLHKSMQRFGAHIVAE